MESDIIGSGTIPDGTRDGLPIYEGECRYTITIYPSQDFKDEHITPVPVVITLAVAGIFAFTIVMFFVYDRLVERRQNLVLTKAVQSTAIVSSLFPKNVRDRLMDSARGSSEKGAGFTARVPRFKSLESNKPKDETAASSSVPIADLFSECTVLFADIAG